MKSIPDPITDAQSLQFQPTATPADNTEDLARANLCGLLVTLSFHTANADLLQRIAAAPLDPIGDGDVAAASAQAVAGSALAQAWRKLVVRADQTIAEWADDEYTELSIGVDKPKVFLYGSYYRTGFINEKPFVVLRDDLRRHSPEHAKGVTEAKDHLATLYEVMCYLIVRDNVAVARIGEQHTLLQHHLAPWVDTACDAVLQHPRTALYTDAVGLAKTFFDVERFAPELA